jgi:hypothetical protein
MKRKQIKLPRPLIYIGCGIFLLLVLLTSFTCGTIISIASEEIGVWNKSHEMAENADCK